MSLKWRQGKKPANRRVNVLSTQSLRVIWWTLLYPNWNHWGDSSGLSNADISSLDPHSSHGLQRGKILSFIFSLAPHYVFLHFPLYTWSWMGTTQHPKCQKHFSAAVRIELLKVLQCQREYINANILLNQQTRGSSAQGKSPQNFGIKTVGKVFTFCIFPLLSASLQPKFSFFIFFLLVFWQQNTT